MSAATETATTSKRNLSAPTRMVVAFVVAASVFQLPDRFESEQGAHGRKRSAHHPPHPRAPISVQG
jgi:hypothetical protein